MLAWLALIVVAANGPDLDFLPGLLIGDVNRFHHGPSHSIAAALIAAVAAGWGAVLAGGRGARTALVVLLAWSSHLLADYAAADPREPRGVPLLWPFSDAPYIAPVTLFMPFDHGSPGDDLGKALAIVFSLHNVYAIVVELALTAPLAAAGLWLGRQRAGRQSQRSSRT
jgi:membrane-bound metal-dependent hydrolase YbcI (DUF457 family)